MQTFYEWLQQYQTVDSAIGDLARTAYLDRNRPQVNTLAAWEDHIAAMGRSYAAGNVPGEPLFSIRACVPCQKRSVAP